jgi:cell division protein FtsZ
MAQNKRASMREGPLAALFRKTAEDREQERKPSAQPERPPSPPAPPPSEPEAQTEPPV